MGNKSAKPSTLKEKYALNMPHINAARADAAHQNHGNDAEIGMGPLGRGLGRGQPLAVPGAVADAGAGAAHTPEGRAGASNDIAQPRGIDTSISKAVNEQLPLPSPPSQDLEDRSVLFTRAVNKGVLGMQPHKGFAFSGAMDQQRSHVPAHIIGKEGISALTAEEMTSKSIPELGSPSSVDRGDTASVSAEHASNQTAQTKTKPANKRVDSLRVEEGLASLDKKGTPRDLAGQQGRGRFNSTSTLFVQNTMHSPNPDDVLRCVATALYMIIKEGEKTFPKTYYHVFSEDIHPIAWQNVRQTSQYPNFSGGSGGVRPSRQCSSTEFQTTRLPPVQDIYEFLRTIFTSAKLTSECAVVFLIYVERVLRMSGMTLDRTNWRWTVLGCTILAAKVWDDLAVWNIDFCGAFPNLTVQALNRLEREILKYLNFTVTVRASEYATYYFELRTLSEELRRPFQLKPLSLEEALAYERRTTSTETTMKLTFDVNRPKSKPKSKGMSNVMAHEVARVASCSNIGVTDTRE